MFSDVIFPAVFFYHVGLVSSRTYSCDRTAQCGCSKNDAVTNKIVGGEEAAVFSWGWAVSLQDKSTGAPFCGGTIVSPLHIVTAAHCVPNATAVLRHSRVVVGINKLNESNSAMAQVRLIVGVTSHPGYNDGSKANDIAVLRLSEPLILSNERSTARICLPNVEPSNVTNLYPSSGTPLVAVGWGTLYAGAPSVPPGLHLQQVTLDSMRSTHWMCLSEINDRQLQFCAAVVAGGKGRILGSSRSAS